MVIVTPVVSAAIAAAWASAQPVREVVRDGTVVTQGSFWHGLVWAALGVLLGVAVVTGAVALWCLGSYVLRRDTTWEMRWALSNSTPERGMAWRNNGAQLRCRATPPIALDTLGYIDAVVRHPDGHYSHVPRSQMRGGVDSVFFAPVEAPDGSIPSGHYEVRWYGTSQRRLRFEVTRGRYDLAPPDAEPG